MNRRGFAEWLFGFLGFGATTSLLASEAKLTMKGFITVYLNVGQLPAYKAEAFIDRMKEKWNKDHTRKELDAWEIIILPVRNQESKVEIFALDGKPDYINAQRLLKTEPFVAPDEQYIIDYILLRLGSPVIDVELSLDQLRQIIDFTLDAFKGKGDMCGFTKVIFGNMAVAKAKTILGMIRRKWSNEDDYLIKEGNEELSNCVEYLRNIPNA